MRRAWEVVYLACAVAMVVAGVVSAPDGVLRAQLVWAALPFGIALALGRQLELNRAESFAFAALLATGAGLTSLAAGGAWPLAFLAWTAIMAVLLVLARWGGTHGRAWAGLMVLAGTLLASASLPHGLLRAEPGTTSVGRDAAAPRLAERDTVSVRQPQMFAPLDIDATGRRVLLWSLVDGDADDDGDSDTLSLWSLDVMDGSLHRVYQGYPLPFMDWAPTAERLVFAASERPWGDEEPVPFGIYVSPWTGGAVCRLKAPTDGTSWMYPSWSRKGEKVAAWLLPEAPEFGSTVRPKRDVPKSFMVPADGGEPQLVQVRGCQLSLLAAWEATAEGGYIMTERGIYRQRPGEKPVRLVAAGEAPLDPFPVALQDGVSPAGGYLGYLAITFKSGEISRIDLRVVDGNGRKQGAIGDIVPVAFAWSSDDKVLAAVTKGRGGEFVLNLLDPASHKVRALRTGLKPVHEDFPTRLTVSRDGRYVCLNGPFEDGKLVSVAVTDLQTGKTQLLPGCGNHLVSGWRADNWIVASDTRTITAVSPDGQRKPIYVPANGLAACPGPGMLQAWSEAQQRGALDRIARSAQWQLLARK